MKNSKQYYNKVNFINLINYNTQQTKFITLLVYQSFE